MAVLITGGAGYIGSHTCVELLTAGKEVVVIDDLSNANAESLERVRRITGKPLVFYRGDIRDGALLTRIFQENEIDSVIHFAGYKSVNESVAHPLRYFQNNIGGTVALCEAMRQAGVKKLVFSSSATVYGAARGVPVREDFPRAAASPYGRTKIVIEDILGDVWRSDKSWSIVLLRYFNPVGAHESGLIGESPHGEPANLMPYITQVAAGKRERLQVFGDDYDTPDGTGVRDFIHVTDVAKGHLSALQKIESGAGVFTYNLGTGKGCSVLALIRTFEQVTGISIPYRIAPRREGDIATCYADAGLANRDLHWRAEKTVAQMCEDAWRWQRQNPAGYETI